MRNFSFFTFLLTLFFLSSENAIAATHYVRIGASGSANGND
ncbi:MAG: hypothetical protein AABY64_09550 [Bdellovibrionota bacterium]